MNIERTPKGPEVKPESVTIKPPFTVVAFPTQMGSPGLLINAMGDDEVIYHWNGTQKRWEVQL